MSTKKLKIYSNRDFQAADRLERIYMAMIEPERFEPLLRDGEEVYMRQLGQAYHGCFGDLRDSVSVKYIQNNIVGCESVYKAKRLLDDMQALYGRFLKKNNLIQKAMVVERMYEAYENINKFAKLLYDEGNHEKAVEVEERAMNILEKAAKMEGLDKVASGLKPEDIQLPAIIVTNDARVLRAGIEEAEIDEEE